MSLKLLKYTLWGGVGGAVYGLIIMIASNGPLWGAFMLNEFLNPQSAEISHYFTDIALRNGGPTLSNSLILIITLLSTFGNIIPGFLVGWLLGYRLRSADFSKPGAALAVLSGFLCQIFVATVMTFIIVFRARH